MYAEKSCLKCHASQGYKLGDLRGGISVSIPMAPYRAKRLKMASASAIGHGLIWLLGLLGLIMGRRQVLRREAERARAEQNVRDQERRYRGILQSTTDGFLVLSAGGIVLDVNDAYCRMTGFSREALLGRGIQDLEQQMATEEVALLLESVMARDNDRFETVHRCADGGEVQVEVSISYLSDQDGIFYAFVSDTTERKELEEQLRQAQKMEAVGQLAGGVAHDFNNLLQAILGNAELAREFLPDGADSQEELDEILKAADRAKGLVAQLLAFSRRQMLQLEPLDLGDVVCDLSRMVRRVIGEHIQLIIQPVSGLRPVHADRGQVEQVLLNLCVNARDAMPGGGEITISVRNVTVEHKEGQPAEWPSAGEFVVIKVADTGSGMTPETLSRIYEPFFTTKEAGRGTGRGLSTVYGIVRQHGGRMKVHSAPREGTTFEVFFPSLSSEEATPVPEMEPERAGMGEGELILVAEDNEGVRRLAVRLLERAGYTVIAAEDGEAGLALFQRHKDEVKLALLDVVMPGLSGPDLYRQIQKIRPGLKVVFASGFNDPTAGKQFVLDPGHELVRKPFEKDALLRILRRKLDR